MSSAIKKVYTQQKENLIKLSLSKPAFTRTLSSAADTHDRGVEIERQFIKKNQ